MSRAEQFFCHTILYVDMILSMFGFLQCRDLYCQSTVISIQVHISLKLAAGYLGCGKICKKWYAKPKEKSAGSAVICKSHQWPCSLLQPLRGLFQGEYSN